MDFVNYAQGLPLALKVLGSFLYEREIDAWESARGQLEAIPNPKIMDVLQISFDGLQELQKELFLDMACFVGGHEHIFSWMLLERFGHHRIDVDVLVEKSLISKSKYGLLSMHDLLKELGREIVRRECRRDHPGGRSRLFCVEDLYHVLETDTGTDATKAIVVEFCAETKDQRLNAKISCLLKFMDIPVDSSVSSPFQAQVVVFDPWFKVDGMIFELKITYGQAWAKDIAARVRKTLDRLFDDFTVLRGGNIAAPTPTPHQFQKPKLGKDVDWTGVRELDHEDSNSYSDVLDYEEADVEEEGGDQPGSVIHETAFTATSDAV
ncbi:TMV resistance protein N-like [Juglans regia]|uniref:TMV resistance protein N-like n=1 Tax=Juglans regia TaxID=51240 RepID=A0A6P9E676_JUGRE|nr:TMV resistance protein N-like [Juglans regia]